MLPVRCPSCQSQLKAKSLGCAACATEVNGSYDLPVLATLSPEDQDFIIHFVRRSGSIKDMAAHMKLSYPTVRNKLNEIIQKIEDHEQ